MVIRITNILGRCFSPAGEDKGKKKRKRLLKEKFDAASIL